MGDLRARAAVAESDRIFALGTRLSETDRYGIETMLLEKPLVLLNDEDSALRGPAWEFKPCDLEALLERLPDAPLLQENNATPLDQLPGPLEREIELSDLAPLLAPLARSRAQNWVLDAGNSTASVAGSLPIDRGSTLTIALGMGGMGYSFGAGIGASLARPLPTVVVAGDGAFFMHGSEISTAVERNIPIHIILIDNHGHGMCATREELFFGRKESPLNRISRSRLAQGLAALYPTIPVRHAATCADASETLKPSCGTQGPSITVLEVSNREVPAFLPFQDLLQKRSLS
jgi:acetolactate synthase-1/2/3 large subunit